MRVVIALKLVDDIPTLDADYIGADKGAAILADKGIPMVAAIGDFDSIHVDDMNKIQSMSDEVIYLNPIKNDSDAEAALKYAIEKGYDEIVMCGAFGGRIDHTYYNIRLAYQYPNLLKLCDKNNLVYALKEGTYKINKNGFRFISFFTDEEAILSLNDFEYTLNERRITKDDLYTLSNKIMDEVGTITIKKGTVLVLQTKDA